MSQKELFQNAVKHKDEISQTIAKRRLRAIIYCRVSTDKQEEDGESLDYQAEKCQQYADLHEYDVIVTLQEAKSGFIHYSMREKLSFARQMVRDGLADVIIVYDLRRFSRNFVHSAMIFEEIESHGGQIVSVSENIDNSLTGKLIRSILAWSAESERHKIVEYANRHWQARLAANLPTGTGRVKYGWSWKDDDKVEYIINREEATVRYALFHMFVELDMSLRQIAHKLAEDGIKPPALSRGVKVKGAAWQPSTIREMIIDEANIGTLKLCWSRKETTADGKKRRITNPNQKVIEGGIPAIVTLDLYERAKQKLATNQVEKSHRQKKPEDYLLKGHIFCKACDHKMQGNEREYAYYLCKNNRNKYMACPSLPSIRTNYVDEFVWRDCCQVFKRIEEIKKAIEKHINETIAGMLEDTKGKAQLDALEIELVQARKEQAKHEKGSYYYNLIEKDIHEKEAEIERYKEECTASRLIANQVNLYKQRVDSFLEFLDVMRGRYHQATFQEKRNALDVLGVKVYIIDEERHDMIPQSLQESTREWFTVKEAAEAAGLSVHMLQACVQAGKLQVEMRGEGVSYHVISREALAQFLQETKSSHIKLKINPDMLIQESFTVKELSKITGVKLDTIQHYIFTGRLHTSMKRKTIQAIHRDELLRFLGDPSIKRKTSRENVGQRIEITYSPILTGVVDSKDNRTPVKITFSLEQANMAQTQNESIKVLEFSLY